MGDLTLETALLSHFLYIAMVHRGLNCEYKCGFTVGNNYPLNLYHLQTEWVTGTVTGKGILTYLASQLLFR